MRNILLMFLFAFLQINLFAQRVSKINNYKSFCNSPKNLYSTNSYYNNLEDNYDIKYFKTDISVGVDSNYIKGNVEIMSIANTNIDTLVFELSDTMHVDSVLINNSIRLFTHQDFNIKIFINPSISQGSFFTAKIYFKGSPDPNHINRSVETTVDEVYNWRSTWTLSESYHMNDWLPCKQDLKDKIDSSDFFITVDTNLMAGSNGILNNITDLGNGKHRFEWKSRHPIDYYLISFAVSDYMDYSIYAHPQGYSDSILIQNYIYDTLACLNDYKTDLDRVPTFIENYSNLFGLYPFADEKYGHCLVKLGGGMEHQTMTTIGFFDFRVVAHELAHQWFGDNVTCATWQDIWINEGFASYGEYLSYEFCGSQIDAKDWLIDAHNHALNATSGSIYIPFSDIDNEGRIFNYDLTYRKGASIIHMIRYIINNDSIFFAGLKNFQLMFGDSVATGDDFKNTMSSVSGIDFTDFFNQWYYGEGYPIYNLVWKNYNDTLFIKKTQTTTSTVTPLFTIPLDFKITFTTGGDTLIRLNQTQNIDNYKIYLTKKVDNISIDPYNWLIKSVSSISNINNYKDLDSQINIFPNPSKNYLKIETNNYNIKSINIYNIYGKVVDFKINYSGLTKVINIKNLSKGIYFIDIQTDSGNFVKRFIKE